MYMEWELAMKKVIAFLSIPVLMILLTYSMRVRAQELVLGEEVVVRSFFCTEEKHITMLLETHKNIGLLAAQQVAAGLTQQGVCTVATLPIRPIRVIGSYTNLEMPTGTTTANHIEVQVGDDMIVFTVATIKVIARNEKNPT